MLLKHLLFAAAMAASASCSDSSDSSMFASSHHGIESAQRFALETAAVAAQAQAWANAVNAHNTTAVTALYDSDAVLYATFSTIVDTPQGLADYFAHLFEKAELAVAFTQQTVRLYANNVATNSGLYSFSFRDEGGAVVSVPAR